MVLRSRFYPANKSWTNSPAWAFEIPLIALEPSSGKKEILLRCQKSENADNFFILKVPVDFLMQNKRMFYIRDDHHSISLFLSAKDPDKFKDLRGNGQVTFDSFLEN
jgi:hypothetical protein